MAKVCLINAYEPSYLGTRVLASYMLRHGHSVHNIILQSGIYTEIEQPLESHEGYQAYAHGHLVVGKATVHKISQRDLFFLEEVLRQESPDVIGFSARSTNNWLAPLLLPVFRASCPQAVYVAGGYGPTLEPEFYISSGFHCVVRGDGEDALLEILDSISDRDNDKLYGIKNTVWCKNGKMIINNLRPQEKNISKYGAPLYGHKYYSYINDDELKRFFDPAFDDITYYTYVSRGCVGSCTYCSGGQWRALYSKERIKSYITRSRDPYEIIHSLKDLPRSVKYIFFTDEYFSISSSKTCEFLDLYKKNIGKPFRANLHWGQIKSFPELFKKFLDAGLFSTNIGVQTGDEIFSQECYHRKIKNDDILECANLCFESNIRTNVHFIGGNCYETDDVFKETIKFIRELPFSIEEPSRFHIQNIRLRPHPKTPITTDFPLVESHPMSAEDWWYRAIIMELCRIIDQDQLDEIIKKSLHKDDPRKLHIFFKKCLLAKQREHFSKVIQRNRNKDIIFYGCGELYSKNKYFFSDLRPRLILLDNQYIKQKSIDGIQICNTEDFLSRHADKNNDIIYFTFIKSSHWPRMKLHNKFKIPNENIHSCTSCLM